MSSKSFFNRPFFYILAAVLLFVVIYATEMGVKRYHSDQHIKNRFQQSFLEQSKLLKNKSDEIEKILTDTVQNYWPTLERLLDPEQIYTQIYWKDSLIFWNSNTVQNDLDYLVEGSLDTILREKTAWYLIHFQNKDNYRIFLFKRIKSEYPFENKFLPSEANREFLLSDQISLTTETETAQYVILNETGVPVLGLNMEAGTHFGTLEVYVLFVIYVLIFLFLILWINSLYNKFASTRLKPEWAFVLYVIDLFIIRWLGWYFNYPALLKQSFLFERMFDLPPGFNTVGDLFVTGLFFVAVFIKFNNRVQMTVGGNAQKEQLIRMILLLASWLMAFGVFFISKILVEGLHVNPVLSIRFSDPVNMLALWAVVLLNIALFFMIRSLSIFVGRYSDGFLYCLLLAMVPGIFGTWFFPQIQMIVYVTTAFILGILLFIHLFAESRQNKFIKYLIYVIVFSAANAIVINTSESRAKDIHQVSTAHYLIHKDDPELETYFDEFNREFHTDTVVSLIIENYMDDPESALTAYVKNRYFRNVAYKYDIQLTVCLKDELLEIQPEGILMGCDEYFVNLIQNFGDTTQAANLFLQSSTPESIYYIGVVEPPGVKDLPKVPVIYMEFYFTYVPEGVGYPELLVDNSVLNYDLSGYSFAKYNHNDLVYKFGDYAYHTQYESIREFPEDEFYNHLNYRHLKLISPDGEVLIISRPLALLQEKLATFSILFLLMGLVAFLMFFIVYRKEALEIFIFSFRNRLQVVFIVTISIIVFVIALITAYYAEYSNKERVIDQLNEKTYSVLIELQHKLGGVSSLEEMDTEDLYAMLHKFSMVFFSDINLYDSNGKLVASSRPEVFQMGMLSQLINPLAFEEIFVDNKLFFTTDEKIGTLVYYSSYVPFVNGDETLGIVNLPYFARQTEVEKAYYMMIFTFLNLFVIAGIIGIFMALLLSRFLTKPLLVLQQSLSEIRIDQKNERIDWHGNDEIGMLIREYNQMIDKLEESAELLKHSERESTWREVARQIAHEIKNPLTPMKLNVQHLEKTYMENDSEQKEKIRSISKSLIQQIDTLNEVAEMFSDFAKSNIKSMEKVELLQVIRSSVMLFRNDEGVQIAIHAKEPAYHVRAIEKDLLRLFNNMIKNAIQSIENNEEGKIDVTVQRSGKYIEVVIADNGKGISDEIRTRVFQPYFTTKSGGTGLGLAIVKNIMNEIGGSITFTSQASGTTFYLKFLSAVNSIEDNKDS